MLVGIVVGGGGAVVPVFVVVVVVEVFGVDGPVGVFGFGIEFVIVRVMV